MLSRCLKGHGHEWIFAYFLPFFFNPFQSAQCAAKKDQESNTSKYAVKPRTEASFWAR
jgi:hypothetical protein